jgi:YggT family protein
MSMVGGFAQFVSVVKLALLYGGIFMAVIAAIDWAVRTRRISPFNRIARFFRGHIDPLLAPIERVIVRAGGLPSSAAWWALVAYVIFGLLLMSTLQLVGDIMFQFAVMIAQPDQAWRIIVSWVFSLLILALFVRVLSSWLPISPYSRWIRWSFVLTDWMIRPLQRVVPRIGMFDITPIVAWLLLRLAAGVILG